MNRFAHPPSKPAYEHVLGWCINFITTPGRLKQFLSYTLVSGLSLGLDLSVFGVLMWASTMNAALAGAVSCMVGLVLHYVLSVSVVFSGAQTGKSEQRLIAEYLATGAMGFAITASAIFLTVDVAGLPALLGKVFGIGATFVSVYLVRAGYVFAPAGGHGRR